MIKTNFNGEDVYLINDGPDWESSVTGTVEVLGDIVTSLTQREGRRAYAETLRFTSFSYATTVQGVAARGLTEGLRDLQLEPVIVPLWPAMVRWAEVGSLSVGGNLRVVWKDDWSAYSIYDALVGGPSFGPGADDWVAPALWGRLNKREVLPLRSDVVEWGVDFVESGPPGPINPSPVQYAIVPRAVAWTAGPQPSGSYAAGSVKVMPFEINFEGPKQSFEVSIVREQIGFGRQPGETLYPQTNRRGQEIEHVAPDGDGSGEVLRFFLEHGAGKVFWAQSWTEAVRLTADVGAADTVLRVDDSSTVKVGDFLWFGSYARFGRVTAVGAGSVTIAAALGVGVAEGELVGQLVLCRLAQSRMDLEWLSPEVLRVKLGVTELPPEYTPAGDETIGTTLGYLPARVWLYELSWTAAGEPFADYYTSHEQQVVVPSGHTYEPLKIQQGEIKQGLMLDADELQITAQIFRNAAGRPEPGPLVDMAALRMEGPLFLTLKRAELDGTGGNGFVNADGGSVEVLYVGEFTGAHVKGSTLTAKAVSGGSMFDRMITRVRFQLSCNNALFDAGCTLGTGDWKWTSLLHANYVAGSYQVVVDTLNHPVAHNPAIVANFFALGWLELLPYNGGLGSPARQVRPVLTSTVIGGGLMTLTIDRDLVTVDRNGDAVGIAGDTVLILPGCDLSYGTCGAKFNNQANFLGHPFLPLSNPALVKSNPSVSGGKK